MAASTFSIRLSYTAAAATVDDIGLACYLSNAGVVTKSTASTAQGGGALGVICDVVSATEVTVCVAGACKAKVGDTFTTGTTTMWAMAAADSRLDPYAVIADTAFASQNQAIGFFPGTSSADFANGDLQDFVVALQLRPDTQT